MAKARAQLIFLDNNHGDNKNKVVITKEAVRHFGPSVVDLKELLNQPEDNKNIIIGRGALSTVVDCRISVRESSKSNDIISRKHAEIKYISKLDAFVINDLNSSNGTFVNSVRIDSHTLCDGDIIQFGGSSCLAVGDEFRGNSPCIRYRFCYDVQPYPDGPGQGRKRTHMKEQVITDPSEHMEGRRFEDRDCGTNIEVSALLNCVRCPLCHKVLLNAVVCKCSHSFCLGCLYSYHKMMQSLCPVCNDDQYNLKSAFSDIVTTFYYRSEALDNLIWMIVEACGMTTITEFESREREQQNIIREYYEICKNKMSEVPAATCNHTEQITRLRESKKLKLSSERLCYQRCTGCGEQGHSLSTCPHADPRDRKSANIGDGYNSDVSGETFGLRHGEEDDT